MRMAVEMLAPFRGADREEYENRVIFLTDAMPNTGATSEDSLLGITRAAAAGGVYATFIGIGVDFNTELVSGISRVRGANYYAVHSARDFAKRLDDEFEFMVTPLVFDLRLQLDASGYEIVGVYGSPEASEAMGEIMKVNTLFPSKVEGGETRGGVILLHLRAAGPGGRRALTASYEDRQGRRESETATVSLPRTRAVYPNTGIRKAILLARYGNLLRTWLADERAGRDEHHPVIVSITDADGIPCPRPAVLGRWERQSLPLAVSGGYKPVLSRFLAHFRDEARAVNDPSLDKEVKVLELLVNK
jgi:Ca-activated chloride channel family protein